MRAPRKSTFWDQPTDAAMYKFLLVRGAIALVAGTIAWFIGHAILRAFVPR